MTVAGHNAQGALGVEALHMTMRFGALTALDDVSIQVPPGSFHALLGENGAGKSTLVKCMMGFYHATSGEVMVDGTQTDIKDPRDAQALGLGMVYQHFTLVPSLTGAENLVIARLDTPAVIDWRSERQALRDFMAAMPFDVPLDRPVIELAAGEKQKLEIIKQLYLGRRFLILDEPTSVLTPGEADEVLGLVKDLTKAGRITVLMITHKFREVTMFADAVTVLRRGVLAGGGKVSELSHAQMAAMMVGEELNAVRQIREEVTGATRLELNDIRADDRTGLKSIEIDGLAVKSGEIVGIAGVSGNGQKELIEILSGQRPLRSGEIKVNGEPFAATRAQAMAHNIRYIPEEPLLNACAAKMAVGENLAFRSFDRDASGNEQVWLNKSSMAQLAAKLVQQFKIKTASLKSPMASLSGGNVQRAVLARELTGEVDLLIVANPCFGLDFSAVAEIRERIMTARNDGAAVLLISEDLDEIMELADRVLVMSEGRISYDVPIAQAEIGEIGRHMAGHA